MNESDFNRDEPDRRIIQKQNIFRAEKGIRAIDEDWYFYGNEFNAQKWKVNIDDPGGKTVQMSSGGEIQYEEDYYYSGSSYTTINGKFLENLVIHYDYLKDQFDIVYLGNDPKVLSVLNEVEDGEEGVLDVADRILSKWEISRL